MELHSHLLVLEQLVSLWKKQVELHFQLFFANWINIQKLKEINALAKAENGAYPFFNPCIAK